MPSRLVTSWEVLLISSRKQVTRLLDIFPDESNLVLVQEYLPSDLAEVIEQSTAPLPRANFKRYAFMLLDALSYIHSQGIIHRVRRRCDRSAKCFLADTC